MLTVARDHLLLISGLNLEILLRDLWQLVNDVYKQFRKPVKSTT